MTQTDKEKLRKAFNLRGDRMSDKEKIEETLKLIDGLLESPHAKRVMVTPEVSLVVILEKIKETLT